MSLKLRKYENWIIDENLRFTLNGMNIEGINEYSLQVDVDIYRDNCGHFYILGIDYAEKLMSIDCVNVNGVHIYEKAFQGYDFQEIFNKSFYEVYASAKFNIIKILDDNVNY